MAQGQSYDLTGMKIHMISVIDRAEDFVDSNGKTWAMWNCKCDCGTEFTTRAVYLRRKLQSCGCLNGHPVRHGLTYHPLRSRWKGMVERCTYPQNKMYKYYGGRGIKVCKEWLDYPTFYEWAISNGWSESLQLDRIDNDGDYCPENCRWISHKEQMSNSRVVKMYEYRGKTQCISDWAREYGLCPQTVSRRLRDGWGLELALNTPPRRDGKSPIANGGLSNDEIDN